MQSSALFETLNTGMKKRQKQEGSKYESSDYLNAREMWKQIFIPAKVLNR